MLHSPHYHAPSSLTPITGIRTSLWPKDTFRRVSSAGPRRRRAAVSSSIHLTGFLTSCWGFPSRDRAPPRRRSRSSERRASWRQRETSLPPSTCYWGRPLWLRENTTRHLRRAGTPQNSPQEWVYIIATSATFFAR